MTLLLRVWEGLECPELDFSAENGIMDDVYYDLPQSLQQMMALSLPKSRILVNNTAQHTFTLFR